MGREIGREAAGSRSEQLISSIANCKDKIENLWVRKWAWARDQWSRSLTDRLCPSCPCPKPRCPGPPCLRHRCQLFIWIGNFEKWHLCTKFLRKKYGWNYQQKKEISGSTDLGFFLGPRGGGVQLTPTLMEILGGKFRRTSKIR